MLYPIYVHPGDDNHAHGITIPDFPGCFSATDSWDDIQKNVQEAMELYCEDETLQLPRPSSIEKLLHKPDYVDGVWLMVEINTSKLSRKVVSINITVQEADLYQIDLAAKKAGLSRSGFMTEAAIHRL